VGNLAGSRVEMFALLLEAWASEPAGEQTVICRAKVSVRPPWEPAPKPPGLV
jgi:hypothetical protein